MRRLATVAAALAAVLALAAAPAARAEPLDIDLTRIGAPDPEVWTTVLFKAGGLTLDPAQLAREAKQRFAVLSTEMALALSSAVLQTASTTGHSGFAVDLEVATMTVEGGKIGTAPPPSLAGTFTNRTWATNSTEPAMLYLPSVHVRKGLPWSFELGGRMIYLAQSSYYAAQGEAKWALNEGFDYLPDFAVRGAYTRLFNHPDWNLGTADLDVMLSKRWGLRGVISLTPYLVGRLTYVSASSGRMDFYPDRSGATLDPASLGATQASFPTFTATLYRTTLGLRFTTYAVSLALEGTYFGGASPKDDDYEGVKVASAFGGAAKLGWEF
jgi:hypothetical protein